MRSGSMRRARPRAATAAVLLGLSLGAAAAAPALRAQVPTPESVIGFQPGTDYKLADYAEISSYFHALDEASDRITLYEIGETALGRPMMLALISSAENLRHAERYKTIARQLARARDLDDAKAHRLAEEGKAILWIDGGLHASEVAAGQMTSRLAYHLVTSEDAEARRIREETIVLLMPVMNPDGLDIVVDWYERNLGTPFETAPLPVLYHEYVGHDNNRDWFMMLQPETKAVARQLWEEWYPQIVYNHHQTGSVRSRIMIPPFADPMNPNIPPLVMRGINLVGAAMGYRFAQEGKPGAVSRVRFSAWWNGGMRTAPYFHNQIGILTEARMTAYATPEYEEPGSLPASFPGGISTERPSVFYPNPWRGGWWRLGDAVNYMLTGSLAVLDIGARMKEDWLYDTYLMARSAIEAGAAGGPFAYVVPAEQWDGGEAVELVNALRRGGVEVQRARRPFTADGKEFPAGAYIAFAAQPFRAHLVDLMEAQQYPDRRLFPGGPPVAPYDLAGWTLPIQMGVNVVRVENPFRADVEPVEVAAPEGRVAGRAGFGCLLDHRANASALAVNRLLAAGARVSWAGTGFEVRGEQRPAGTIVVQGAAPDRLEALAWELGLAFTGIDERPDASLHPLRLPRVGLYKSWVANIDEGWTRWLLEQYEFPFDTLHDADIRNGDLSRYDVIILPDQDAQEMLRGHAPGTMPPEFVGGLGASGAAALAAYVRNGGTVLALDGASDFAIEQFGLPVRNVISSLSPNEFYIPGSLIRLSVDPQHPVAFGMPDEGAAFFVESRAFEVIQPASAGEAKAARDPVEVVARYAPDDLLLSGWALGEERYLAGRPAVVRATLGKGDVVLVGFRAQFRGQSRNTFKLLFNTLHGATLDALPVPSGRVAAQDGTAG